MLVFFNHKLWVLLLVMKNFASFLLWVKLITSSWQNTWNYGCFLNHLANGKRISATLTSSRPFGLDFCFVCFLGMCSNHGFLWVSPRKAAGMPVSCAGHGSQQRARLGSCCRLVVNAKTAGAAVNSTVTATNAIVWRIHITKMQAFEMFCFLFNTPMSVWFTQSTLGLWNLVGKEPWMLWAGRSGL